MAVGGRMDIRRIMASEFTYRVDDKTEVIFPKELVATAIRQGDVITITFPANRPYAKYAFVGAHITDLILTRDQLKVGLLGYHPVTVELK